MREEYRFAKEFLGDLESNGKLHHLAVERGYYAIAGTSSIKVSEIKYLMSLAGADKRLRDYVLSRKYLELKESSNKIVFRKKYKSRWSKVWRKTLFLSVYMVGSAIALSPLLLMKPMALEPKFLLMQLFMIPVFGFFAADALRGFMKLSIGEALVREQEEHTPLIFVKK